MQRLFLDANIFFAATYSETGASRFLFELARKAKAQLVSSLYALKEAQVNIEKKMGPESLPLFFGFVSLLTQVDKEAPNRTLMPKYEKLIVPKDLPILCSSISMGVDVLITLDRKDFMKKVLEQANLPFKILLPGDYLRSL